MSRAFALGRLRGMDTVKGIFEMSVLVAHAECCHPHSAAKTMCRLLDLSRQDMMLPLKALLWKSLLVSDPKYMIIREVVEEMFVIATTSQDQEDLFKKTVQTVVTVLACMEKEKAAFSQIIRTLEQLDVHKKILWAALSRCLDLSSHCARKLCVIEAVRHVDLNYDNKSLFQTFRRLATGDVIASVRRVFHPIPTFLLHSAIKRT
jgi:hypothetical protein